VQRPYLVVTHYKQRDNQDSIIQQWRRGKDFKPVQGRRVIRMNSTELQTILSTVLRQQEQRFTQLMETLRLANGVATQATPTQATCSEQRNSHPPHLLDIEAYVADIENPTHLEDWLKRFEMSLLCAAPNISHKIFNGCLRRASEVLSP